MNPGALLLGIFLQCSAALFPSVHGEKAALEGKEPPRVSPFMSVIRGDRLRLESSIKARIGAPEQPRARPLGYFWRSISLRAKFQTRTSAAGRATQKRWDGARGRVCDVS